MAGKINNYLVLWNSRFSRSSGKLDSISSISFIKLIGNKTMFDVNTVWEKRHKPQSLLIQLFDGNLFPCQHFETSSHFLFHSSDEFGNVTIKCFTHRHKRNRFVMFEYAGADLIISYVGVSFCVIFIFQNIAWKCRVIRWNLVF